jgi:chaperonin GroES
MLDLDNKITFDKDTIDSPNLCDKFTEDDLCKIGDLVWQDYQSDVQSRVHWLQRNSAGMDLAMQIQKDKSFPWPGCSNIAFPLITIAALQFHSRAYPDIVDGTSVVQSRVIGPDPDGAKTARSERISTHMSWQLLEQDEDWEEQTDRALLNVPIVGTAWKKTYFSGDKGRNESDLVLARDLVINYWAKNVEDYTKTHLIPMSRNTIHSRILSGVYRDVREEEWYDDTAPAIPQTEESVEIDNRSGMEQPQPDTRTPFLALEQHRTLDLDGDGYAEPYIVTIENSTHCVLRIVARADSERDVEKSPSGEIIRIQAHEYFTKIPFIPSADGSIMDIGYGVLLGPLNESVNSAVNQLFDSGTISNTAGGFLGRGAKIRGGVYNFSPFEWNRVDSTGDDLRKSVIPLPVREPSSVMFQLLSLLINYTEKISGAVDISTGGNPGQNTPAQTSQTMIEQGQKVYAAIFKRIWRSMKQEYKKLYILNAIHLPAGKTYFAGGDTYISRADYLGDSSSVVPVADPNVMSDQARFKQASALMQVANGNLLYSPDEVNKYYLKSMKIPNIDKVYLGLAKKMPPPLTEKVQIEQLKVQVAMANLQWKKLQYMSSLFEQRRLNEAKIISLYAQAAFAQQQAGGIGATANIEEFKAKIDALKMMNDSITQQAQQVGENDNTTGQDGTGGQGTIPQLEGPSGDGNANGMGNSSAQQTNGAMG